jgi:hypothetical protein
MIPNSHFRKGVVGSIINLDMGTTKEFSDQLNGKLKNQALNLRA